MMGGFITNRSSKSFQHICVRDRPLGMTMVPPLLGEPSDYVLNDVSPDYDTPQHGKNENFASVAHDKL